MISVSVQVNIAQARKALDLCHAQIKGAASRAINRGINAGRAASVRNISDATKFKQKDIRARMFIRGSRPDYLVATLGALPFAPNLGKFNAHTVKAGIVRANAWEGAKDYHKAFMLGVRQRVFKRRGSRLVPVYGPSLPNVFKRADMVALTRAAMVDRFEQVFAYELTRRGARAL